MTLRRLSLILFLPVLPLSCKSAAPAPATAPVIEPTASQKKFEDPSSGIRLLYPSAWKVVSTDPTEFKFEQDGKGDAVQLALDVPKLPAWHIPGLIPIDSVRDGYVDDVKKRMTGAQVNNLPDPSVPDAKQHRVMLTGQVNGQPAVNDAATIVHGDHVFILSIETTPAEYPQLKKQLEAVLGSVAWMK